MRHISLFLSVLVPVCAHSQTPVRYRFESLNTTKSEMPSLEKKMAGLAAQLGENPLESMGRANTETIKAVLTLTRRDSAGGVVWHAVVDSFAHDAGKQEEALKALGLASSPAGSLIGAFVEFFVKDGKSDGRVRTSLARVRDLQALGDELQSAFSIPGDVTVGTAKADSTFIETAAPGQGSANSTKTKSLTRRGRPTNDSIVVVSEVLTNSDLGGPRGGSLSATTDTKNWTFNADATLKGHVGKSESTIVMLVPMSGLQLTQSTVTKSLKRIP